jgi:hypothetical protein
MEFHYLAEGIFSWSHIDDTNRSLLNWNAAVTTARRLDGIHQRI